MMRPGLCAVMSVVLLAPFGGSGAVVPGETWQTRAPDEVGLDGDRLQAFSEFAGGRGCVVRDGYLVHTWGDHRKRGDVASAAKPIYSHLLMKAIELGKVRGLDEPVDRYEPGLRELNANLGHKDRDITWRHLSNQVSCYGVRERPGEAFDYSDPQMALFWDLLFLKAYGSSFDKVDEQVLRPLLTDPLGCEDGPTFMAFGTGNRPGRLAISPRDFCRFGLLYLRQGNWNGVQLLEEKHALQVVSNPLPNSIPRTRGEKAAMLAGQRSIGGGNNQTDHLGSYSFLWWTNGVDREGQRHWPDVPHDAYGAFGHGGPRAMVVIPSLDLVVSWNDTGIEGREAENEALKRLVAAVRSGGPSTDPTSEGASRPPRREPPAGQIGIDPEHPQFLKRHGGKHLFVCGPGDPEDFLYRGVRRSDGTRAGDQEEIINRLAKHGGNCLYLQMIRSHGGDGEADHNPFIDHDPSRGLNESVLDQWEEWFQLMDEHDILIYLFLYDDGANPWRGEAGEPEQVPEAERAFVEAVVKRFDHHRNLIWLVAEESEEAYRNERVRAIARLIEGADMYGHLIGNHHHSGVTFKAWEPGCALTHYAMQLNADVEESHRGAVEAVQRAAGRYQVIYAENTALENSFEFAWAAAMGGAMPMILKLDLEDEAQLRRCRDLQQFFEAVPFWRLSPHDELADGATQWVLAEPGEVFLLRAAGPGALGLKQMPAGPWELRWLDCESGRRATQSIAVREGVPLLWERPAGFSDRTALAITRP